MKTLLAILLLISSSAFGASVTINNPSAAVCIADELSDGNVIVNCGGAAPATPFCTIMPNRSTTINQGQSIGLGSSCSPIATAFQWTGPGITDPSLAAQTVTPSVTSTYTLTGSNANGPGNTATITVTVIPAPVTDLCAAQGLSNVVIPMDWGGGNLKEFQVAQNQVVSFVLNVGAEPMGGSLLTTYGSSEKLMSISTKKCDFAETLPTRCINGASDPGLWYTNGTSRYACQMTPNTAYYVNVRNAVLVNNTTPVRPIVDSCTQGMCTFWLRY